MELQPRFLAMLPPAKRPCSSQAWKALPLSLMSCYWLLKRGSPSIITSLGNAFLTSLTRSGPPFAQSAPCTCPLSIVTVAVLHLLVWSCNLSLSTRLYALGFTVEKKPNLIISCFLLCSSHKHSAGHIVIEEVAVNRITFYRVGRPGQGRHSQIGLLSVRVQSGDRKHTHILTGNLI